MGVRVPTGNTVEPMAWAPSRGAIARAEPWLAAGVVLAAVVFAYWQPLASMVRMWNSTPMYSYAFAVPAISAYLLWNQRRAVAAAPSRPAWLAGGLVLAASLALGSAGRAAEIEVVQQLAFLGSLLGAVLLIYGAAVVRAAWMPLAYLLLMIPIWDGLTEPLHQHFQVWSAAIGTTLLKAIGIAAYREDNFIALPNITLEVARACSGVNYLVAVVAVGLPLAFLYLPGIWRRVLLLSVALVIAGLANGVRVALIGWLAYLDVGSPLHGPAHVLHGLFVSAVGYLCLFGGVSLLTPADSHRSSVTRECAPHSVRVAWQPAIVAIAVFIAAGVIARADGPAPIKLSARLDDLPSQLGPWAMESAHDDLARTASWWPGTDVSLVRRYRQGSHIVNVFVGYFERQSPGRELASFQNADLHRVAQPIMLESGSGPFPVNFARMTGRRPFDAIFWYEVGGTAALSPVRVKLLTARNHLLQGRSDGAVVMLLDDAPDGTGGGKSAMQDLAGRLRQALVGCFPPADRTSWEAPSRTSTGSN